MKKEITMKTLSKITRGGKQYFVIACLVTLVSCDVFPILLNTTIERSGHKIGLHMLSTSYDPYSIYFHISCDTTFFINPDALRIENPSNDIHLTLRFHERVQYDKRGYPRNQEQFSTPGFVNQKLNGEGIKFAMDCQLDFSSADTISGYRIQILPSDYIICNGERLIDDTITICLLSHPSIRKYIRKQVLKQQKKKI